MTRSARQSGFTIIEIAVVISIFGIVMSALSTVFTRNHELVRDTRALQQVEAVHRNNLEALTRVFRNVDLTTLANLDGEGESTNPGFSRVTGADLDDVTYSENESLIWLPTPIPVNGVVDPGAVYLVTGGRRLLVASRVPKGGFRVRQEGRSIAVSLTSYYVTSAGRVSTRSTESVISVRN